MEFQRVRSTLFITWLISDIMPTFQDSQIVSKVKNKSLQTP